MKKIKARGSNVLLEGTIKTQTNSGIIIAGEEKKDNIERGKYLDKLVVMEPGTDVKDLKKGDEVIVFKDTLMKLSYSVKDRLLSDDEQKQPKYKEKFYILVPEDEIKGICQ